MLLFLCHTTSLHSTNEMCRGYDTVPLQEAIMNQFKLVALLAFAYLMPLPAQADIQDCLQAAYAAVDPNDMVLAAKFATNHPTCLSNLVPPYVIPYAALSGSLDVANQSGALNKVGMGFNSYGTCAAKFDPAKVSLKAMSPVIKPICNTIDINCQALEQPAANAINSQLAQEFPVLSMLPCACAAATSGLGVAKIADLVGKTKSCGGTVVQVAGYLNDGAKGAYKEGKQIVNTIGNTANDLACDVISLFGGCSSAPPPPTGVSEAGKWCKPYGGIKYVKSATNQPNDYSVTCNDGAACIVKPNEKPKCITAAEKAVHEQKVAQQNAVITADNTKLCGIYHDLFKSEYDIKCHDNQCRTGVNFVVSSVKAACLQGTNGGLSPFPAKLWFSTNQQKYRNSLDVLVKESIIRDPKAMIADKLGAEDCRSFLGRTDEMLCPTQAGFDLCKITVDAGTRKVCRFSKEVYTGKSTQLKINPSILAVPKKP